jgi:dimethylhistidine N-methyltransferase
MLDALVTHDDIITTALAGLMASPKTLPPKLFYDVAGVELFEKITSLPEYYLTRTEIALLRRAAPEIVSLAEPGSALVEYGASDAAKASILLDAGVSRFAAYVPVDIAADALHAIEARLGTERKALAVFPVCGDFLVPLPLPGQVEHLAKFGFFPGSTIGNLEPHAAGAFLAAARNSLGKAAFMIVGVDLRKDEDRLLAAYDDASGVTAAFNLNMLRRLNREAGADFDVSRFAHRARWNAVESRIEMHLESLAAQTVYVGGEAIDFAKGETIHTENSYKHSVDGFRSLAAMSGWAPIRMWTDDGGLFSVHALRGK